MAERLGNRAESLENGGDNSWGWLGDEVELRGRGDADRTSGQGEVTRGEAEKQRQERIEQLRSEAQNASRGSHPESGRQNLNTVQSESLNLNNNESSEVTGLGYEAELNTPNDVLRDIRNYVIQNGVVYRKVARGERSKKKGNESVELMPEADEDVVLRVKTSRFLYNEALDLRNAAKRVAGKRFVDRGPQYYINKAMERYAVRDEENDYATNKLVRNLVDQGGVQELFAGEDLNESKYSMLVGLKSDYGRALLERKMRQRGQTIKDLQVNVDTSEFKKNGHSTVEVKLNTGEFVDRSLHHPAAGELTALDEKLSDALQKKDKTAYETALTEARKTVREQALQVTQEEWQRAKEPQRKRMADLKMKEARVLGNKRMYTLWRERRESGNW